jgi:hypothetical protein
LPQYSLITTFASDTLDLHALLSEPPTPVWVALSSAVSGIGAWFVSIRKVNASIERARIKMISDASSGETAERAAFRATLMTEISALRQLVKECETEKDTIRERVNRAEEQILVLNASNEIMEKWIAFFKERNDPEVRLPTKTPGRSSVA